MKAEEIRFWADSIRATSAVGPEVSQIEMLAEIAAQLAELNERLRKWSHSDALDVVVYRG